MRTMKSLVTQENAIIAAEAARQIAKNWQRGSFRKAGGVVAGMKPIIEAAIEKAFDKGWHEGVRQCTRKREIEAHASERCWTEGGTADCLIHPKTDEADWAEDYDLTSFLHGDKTHAELIEANDNLFKIARKYCLENKSLRAEIKEKTK